MSSTTFRKIKFTAATEEGILLDQVTIEVPDHDEYGEPVVELDISMEAKTFPGERDILGSLVIGAK